MNRLWVRLTLAFVAVTVLGVGVLSLLIDWQAGQQFRQYVLRQEVLAQSGIVQALTDYYRQHGSWQGAADVVANFGPGRNGRGAGGPNLLLAGNDGRILYDDSGSRSGGTLTGAEMGSAVALRVDGALAGYLLAQPAGPGGRLAPAAQAFLNQLQYLLLAAAAVAGTAGILLGLAISRTLTAPLSRLASAAELLGNGRWDQRVTVSGADEMAAVGRAFNQMAQSLQAAETLRRNLMADVSHELRTPLTVLQGNMRALLDGVYPLQMAEIATLYDETRLISRLVDDLRDLSLAESGRLPLKLQPVDVSDLLRSLVDNFTAAAEDQGVTITMIAPDTPARVSADPDRLGQVAHNLLSNALRHTPRGGRVSVTFRPDAARQRVDIEVADTGEGIAPDDLPHIFDRFYRGDKSRSRAQGGTGLGLAIAKTWTEAMGGTITASSTVGAGSRFTVSLPSLAAPDEPG